MRGTLIMEMAQTTHLSKKGKLRDWLKSKVFLNVSFAWGIFIGIHVERYLIGIGRKGLLFFL